MSYLDESELSTYDSNLKEWVSSQESKTLTSSIYPWTKTIKAGAVSCYPVGGTELKPTVDFMFSETPPASGDKGPENPSTITGVSSVKVTRCGKNLRSFTVATQTKNGVTCTNNGDGTYTLNGLASADASFSFDYASILRPGVYVLSGCPSGGSNTTYYLGASGGRYDAGNGYIINASAEVGLYFWIQIKSGYNCQNLIFKPQLELGSAVTPFEPYAGTDYTLPLGNTYYGGEIDLATGLMTVTHNCTTVNTFYQFTEAKTDCILVRFRCDYYSRESSDLVSYVCDLFPSSRDASDFEHVRQNSSSAVSATLYLAKSRLDLSGAANPSAPTDAEWLAAANAWVAEHPFKFVSMLKTPTTVQLSPLAIRALIQPDKYTPRLNTVYTDASAVQVGYVKSLIREEYELQQAIVGQGGNI